METIKTVEELIECYKKLPSIGSRSAQRLAYATLGLSKDDIEKFINALRECTEKVKKCPKCGTYYDDECPICSDKTRDKQTLLVLSDSKDIFSIEKTNGYHGSYFSLNGTISPLKNRTPESIGIPALKERVQKDEIKEIILALPTDLEGETTSLYIANIYKNDENIHVSKLANGIPIGTNLEYLDNLTITSSIQGRISLNEGNKKNVK